jgi:16S rRNA U516 pseudouridylate synthase RsuA-like enzyme
VTRLKRVALGGLALDDLEPGEWRELNEADLRRIFPILVLASFVSFVVNVL